MTSQEFELYAARVGLSAAAYEYVQAARSSAPARRVDSGDFRNSVWRYPSRKLGLTVALESSQEYGYAVQLEYNTAVLEYWEQPPRVAFTAVGRSGRAYRTTYVPDFLVLFKDQVLVVQVKTHDQCLQKAATQPRRWSVDGDVARDDAASAYFATIGLKHELYTSSQAHRIRVENYSLLLRARQSEASIVDLRRITQALSRVADDAVLTLQQVIDGAGLASATAVLKLLDDGRLFTHFDRCRMSVPTQCLIAKDAQRICDHFAAADVIASSGLDKACMHSKAIREAYYRKQQLEGHVLATRSPRTHRRWRALLRQAGGNFSALAPLHSRKGCRGARLLPGEIDVIVQAVRRHYLRPECPSLSAAYGQYLLDHEDSRRRMQLSKGSTPVCYTTFRRHCFSVPAEERARNRGGRRPANAHASPVPPALRHLTPTRIFERAHVDHYKVDLHVLVGDEDKHETRRPWLSAMRDEATGTVLATSLSFRAPSHLSCLNLIRDCARRHQRLPEALVVDNGAEFHSTYFETVLACLGVTKQSRPPGAPRAGGPIEGWFHSVKAFITTQRGNTTNDARARAASETHKGRKHAVWSIHQTYDALEDFTFRHFNHATSYDSLHSRSHRAERALSLYPDSGLPALFNDDFLAQTSTPLKRKLKLDPARGIRHLGRWFSHPKLFRGHGTRRLEAFEEPWDMNRIYVRFNGELLTCLHGANGAADLSIDFGQALESILFIECHDVRAKQARARLLASAKLARKWHTKPIVATATPPKEQSSPRWPSPEDVRPYPFRNRP